MRPSIWDLLRAAMPDGWRLPWRSRTHQYYPCDRCGAPVRVQDPTRELPPDGHRLVCRDCRFL